MDNWLRMCMSIISWNHVGQQLCFEPHVDAVCKKAHQRMYFYWKLCGFNVNITFLKMFYSRFIESILNFAFVCWHGSLSVQQKNRPQDIIKICSKIAGRSLNDLHVSYKTRSAQKTKAILADPEFVLLPRGCSYKLPLCRTDRFKKIIHSDCHQPC